MDGAFSVFAGADRGNWVELTGSPMISEFGPSVWTGRALQAENDDWRSVGLALLYPAY
jgi:hypothetical protein